MKKIVIIFALLSSATWALVGYSLYLPAKTSIIWIQNAILPYETCTNAPYTDYLWQDSTTGQTHFVEGLETGGVADYFEYNFFPMLTYFGTKTSWQIDSMSIEAMFHEVFRLHMHGPVGDSVDSLKLLHVKERMLDSAYTAPGKGWYYDYTDSSLQRGNFLGSSCAQQLYGSDLELPVSVLSSQGSKQAFMKLNNGSVQLTLPGVHGELLATWWQENGSLVASSKSIANGTFSAKVPQGAYALRLTQNNQILWQGSTGK